ncbi:MAG: hypothetical protein IT247_04630 [Bacteroidia bacterium]|nr:hypothetical protein [Bacteroidia bacterium]MCC6684335.1 hypothetical protein [Bacteroidia bacterium]
MKKLLYVILYFLSISAYCAIATDSIPQKRKSPQNLIEVGSTAAWFFDKHRMNFFDDGGFGWLPIMATSPYIPSYIKYSRNLNEKTRIGLSTYSYGNLYDLGQKIKSGIAKKGDVWRREFDDITLSGDYSFLQKQLNRFVLLKYIISANISYRKGMELVYLDVNDYRDVIHTCMCRYSAIGLGGQVSLDFYFGSHFLVGGTLGYSHYFEKSRLSRNSSYYLSTYRPNRDILVLHPKIGIVF